MLNICFQIYINNSFYNYINYKKWKSGELTSEEAFALPRSWINLDTFDKEGVSRDFIKTITAI